MFGRDPSGYCAETGLGGAGEAAGAYCSGTAVLAVAWMGVVELEMKEVDRLGV